MIGGSRPRSCCSSARLTVYSPSAARRSQSLRAQRRATPHPSPGRGRSSSPGQRASRADVTFPSLAAAVKAANPGDTVTLLDDPHDEAPVRFVEEPGKFKDVIIEAGNAAKNGAVPLPDGSRQRRARRVRTRQRRRPDHPQPHHRAGKQARLLHQRRTEDATTCRWRTSRCAAANDAEISVKEAVADPAKDRRIRDGSRSSSTAKTATASSSAATQAGPATCS